MDSSLLFRMILLLNVSEVLTKKVFNKGGREKLFACSSQTFTQDHEMMKLFLSSESLRVNCSFHIGSALASREMMSMFTSGGLAPSLVITNNTYYGIFHFNLTLLSDQMFWLIDIPRENITKHTDIAAVEEWFVQITLHEGLDIYETEGTLLDVAREPILQWTLGKNISIEQLQQLYPHVVDLKVTKCPCSNDVALIGLILNTTYNGVYIGLTFTGFWNYNDTSWFNLTDLIYAQLQEEHKELTVVDMVLTNHVLVILTSLGLFVSSDLRYVIAPTLVLSRADFCGFEKVDYVKGKLWYNERCFANKEQFEVDYVSITFDRNRTLSESSSCFYSKEPFDDWLPCFPYDLKGIRNVPTVISFLIDQEQNTGIYLLYNRVRKRASVSVSMFKDNQPSVQPKFPHFKFVSFSLPIGMVFHPRSHLLYAYGNQVWLSMDGGNSFEFIADLHGNQILHTFHSYYTSDITFVSRNRRVYFTKAGLQSYTTIGNIHDEVFTLYYDHLGFIHKLTPEHFDSGVISSGLGSSKSIFGQPPDLGFETALAPQYITPKEMVFFAYVPENEPRSSVHRKKFKNLHYKKLIYFRKSGKAYIKRIFRHKALPGFPTSVITDIQEPFGVEKVDESPCLHGSFTTEYVNGSKYILHLDKNNAKALFQDTDVEKTVMIPGYSSFLIISILDPKRALSLATMPENVLPNTTDEVEDWFLYDFGRTNRQSWGIFSRPCHYWINQLDDLELSLNLVKYVDVGESHEFLIKIMPSTDDRPTLEVPPLKLVVGNPTLLEVKAEGSFDEADSYQAKITTTSISAHQGFTTIAMVAWEASTECFATTLIPTLKSSCSYGKSMRHIPSQPIPPEDWIIGVHRDSQGFNMIKTLPVNYRPPSHMGVAIPLTDNFYHADPSKPIPRNLYLKSKESGKYKQCANASSREECNCTNDQKTSQSVAFSDCKEKVHRFKFPVSQYPVVLEISTEEITALMEPPYLVTVTEVNMRENWQLKHTVPNKVRKMKNHLEPILRSSVYNPSGLNLSIKGSELFHFRVSVIPGVTYCNLVDEFQIYVDEVPLPFPGHTLIAVATTVTLGGLIFTAFLLQLRNIHPLRALQIWARGNKVSPSDTSIT